MGNALYIQTLANGEPVALDGIAMEEIFGRHARQRSDGCWLVDLGGREGGELCYEAGDDCATFTHYGGRRLINLIFEFLPRTGAVAYWPDDAPCGAITDAAVLAELPQDMIEAIRPVIVSSSRELEKAICGQPG